jgi:hypothetical protein
MKITKRQADILINLAGARSHLNSAISYTKTKKLSGFQSEQLLVNTFKYVDTAMKLCDKEFRGNR